MRSNFVHFTISKYSLVGYNDFIPLEPEYTFSRTGRHFVPLGIINEDIFTISLLLSDGKYLNFENITNTNLSPSVSDCPDGYIPVPGNHLYGTVGKKGGFCVAKYEMKMDVDEDGKGEDVDNYINCQHSTYNVWDYTKCFEGILVSTANGSPITRIKQFQAKAECIRMGGHLITNEEWMTIARNIELVKENWSEKEVGSGFIYSGHSDKVPHTALFANKNDFDGYYLTKDSEYINKNQKRTLYLSNGEVIWDLSGNVYEWIDLSLNLSKFILPHYDNGFGNKFPLNEYEWLEYNIGVVDYSDKYITNIGNFKYKELFLLNRQYNTNQGIGRLYTSFLTNNENTIFISRGSNWSNYSDTGILTIAIHSLLNSSHYTTGFRCVYTPE